MPFGLKVSFIQRSLLKIHELQWEWIVVVLNQVVISSHGSWQPAESLTSSKETPQTDPLRMERPRWEVNESTALIHGNTCKSPDTGNL